MAVYTGYRLNLDDHTIEVKESPFRDILQVEGYTVNPYNYGDREKDALYYAGDYDHGEFIIRAGTQDELSEYYSTIWSSELMAFKWAVFSRVLESTNILQDIKFGDILTYKDIGPYDAKLVMQVAASLYEFIHQAENVFEFGVRQI